MISVLNELMLGSLLLPWPSSLLTASIIRIALIMATADTLMLWLKSRHGVKVFISSICIYAGQGITLAFPGGSCLYTDFCF